MRVMVTGGAGFIGSNFLCWIVGAEPRTRFLNVDKLTYASNPRSLDAIAGAANYDFQQIDLADFDSLRHCFEQYQPDRVIHFAAESHVDRSIHGPREFLRSNIEGTFNLLELCRTRWGAAPSDQHLFHHVSTDEVYGSLGATGSFTESTAYAPRNPYSASKAASDHLVRAYGNTYDLPYKLTNCSNNYGPRQAPEKFIPLTISRAVAGETIPVYGDGSNVRDWLYVDDHCRAIWQVVERGRRGESYNVGGGAELTNLQVARSVCRVVARKLNRPEGDVQQLIRFVADRPGHDFRYSMDAAKLSAELGWAPAETFESGIEKTVGWYLENADWLRAAQSSEHSAWLEKNYTARASAGSNPGSAGG